MFLEKQENQRGLFTAVSGQLYALIGTGKEFEALRNLLEMARREGTALSTTEATVLREVADSVYSEILEVDN